MVLLLQNKIYDAIRKKWVSATPEELVRQYWIQVMVQELHFPINSLVVEKTLKEIPLLALPKRKIPNRRFDLICFHQKETEIKPLMMVEFKATSLSEDVFSQVIGYNFYIQAAFIAIANQTAIKVGWYCKEKNAYQAMDYLPTYQELKQWK
ncbi:MAG: type I restriction enzyme HsdR N-terminal domain-containing protein [Chlamydiales bacterium]|nr:type I restriction enzyme HsdR N-terminal domain-containing protein [Chlamydiales bacterium]